MKILPLFVITLNFHIWGVLDIKNPQVPETIMQRKCTDTFKSEFSVYFLKNGRREG